MWRGNVLYVAESLCHSPSGAFVSLNSWGHPHLCIHWVHKLGLTTWQLIFIIELQNLNPGFSCQKDKTPLNHKINIGHVFPRALKHQNVPYRNPALHKEITLLQELNLSANLEPREHKPKDFILAFCIGRHRVSDAEVLSLLRSINVESVSTLPIMMK